MNLFEYESKAILRKYGVAIPRGKIALTSDEAVSIARELDRPVFLKAQVTVSGRGKAGGILLAESPEEAGQIGSRLLGSRLMGLSVAKLLVEEKLEVREQYYISLAIDRQSKTYLAMASTSGGIDIEEVAKAAPRKIARFSIDPLVGLAESDALKMFRRFKLDPAFSSRLASVLVALYQAALEQDAELVEINPLIKTASGDLVAADARLIVDDNALFRHPEFAERNLQREEDTPREAEARQRGFAYVDLDGDIGIIGNGAGLVMATLDLVNLFGGKPANFLDIGGGAQADMIKNGVLLVMAKPEVRAVLINILGGITRCDLVAAGVVEGLKASSVKKPVAVRMMGTSEKEGQEILKQNGISYYPNMEKAAEAIITAE